MFTKDRINRGDFTPFDISTPEEISNPFVFVIFMALDTLLKFMPPANNQFILFLPFFNISVSSNNLEDFPRLLLFLFLLGFTPAAALPSLILYGPGNHTWRKKH